MPTLYITDPQLQVKVSSEHLEIFELDGSATVLKRRIPLFDVDRVAVTTRAHLSTGALYQLLKRQIPVSLISGRGRLVGMFAPQRDGDAGIRIRQYEKSRDTPWCLANARALVRAKLLNGRRLLQKVSADKELADPAALQEALESLQALAEKAARAETVDETRGFEGAGSALYFRELRHLFPPEMPFTGRSRRPPKDPVNALLSWTYTLVLSELKAVVAAAGLDPCIGCLHDLSYGRPSLPLDLLEPLRAPLCDLLVLRLANLKVLQPDDFYEDPETGGCLMKTAAMKKFFIQYEQRMERLFTAVPGANHTSFRRVLSDSAKDYLEALQTGRAVSPFLMP